MIFMHFTSQIILLAIGFGVGYAILITASKQKDELKSVGKILGWVLIVMAIILAMFNCYFSMKITKRMLTHPCPMHMMMEHHKRHMMDYDRDKYDGEIEYKKGGRMMDEEEGEYGNKEPIKKNIKNEGNKKVQINQNAPEESDKEEADEGQD